MTTAEIIVVANDVIPGMSLPVAAPGLRAWGLAEGLRAHGHPITIAVDANAVRRSWTRGLPPPRPRDTVVATPVQIGELVRTRKPRAVVIAHSRYIEKLGDIDDTVLVYDLFAPKVLELEQQAPSEGQAEALAALRARKLKALQQCAAVVMNGAKKQEYVAGWLAAAGRADTPTAVVNMPVVPYGPSSYSGGTLHVVIAGYIHPWSHPGQWGQAVAPFINDGSIKLHLVVENHWHRRNASRALPEAFATLAALDGVRSHGVMDYADFRRFLAGCHLSIDLFDRNPERELAFVTRTAVALAGGLPVIHVPFTEVSPLISRADAGWLIDNDDLESLTSILKGATQDPAVFERKEEGARAIARELDPPVATRPLSDLLNEIT